MLFYRLLITFLWIPVALVLLGRVASRRERFGDWLERLGLRMVSSHQARLWVHAASNGELASVRPVLLALQAELPDLTFLVTTNSLSGRELAKSWDVPGVEAQLAPLDTRWAARRLAKRNAVCGLVVVESEFWPNRIAALSQRALPVFVLGARLSRRSARTWRKLAPLARDLQSRISFLSPQDDGSRRRFLSLGAKPEQIGPVLDLKSFYAPPKDAGIDEAVRAAFPRENTWLAASTHAGEDEIILDAHRRLLNDWPELQLIIAPRHPRRGGEIGSLARRLGMTVALRSEGDAPRRGALYVADTLGEMPKWYQAASITFVGGSLVDAGGHTPFEPAVFQSAVMHGPYVRNFTAVYRRLDVSGAAIQVEDAPGLRDAVLQLRDSDRRAAMTRLASATTDHPAQMQEIVTRLLQAMK